MKSNCSVTKIPCTLKNFFKYWLQFTSPLHKLQNKEIEVLSVILEKRYELSLVITDDSVIDNFLFSKEVKAQILEELGMVRGNTFNQICSKFRKAGVLLEGNKLNKRLIPNFKNPQSGDTGRFDLMFLFEIALPNAKQDS